MEHWASAVIEAVDNTPKTPPPSPRIPPAAASETGGHFNGLPAGRGPAIDVGLERLYTNLPRHAVETVTKQSPRDKQPVCTTSEVSVPKKPPTWRLCAALLAGAVQQSLSTGLVMTYGTILSYYATNLLRSTGSPQLSLIGALPAFVRTPQHDSDRPLTSL
jgi:hypothetical protein